VVAAGAPCASGVENSNTWTIGGTVAAGIDEPLAARGSTSNTRLVVVAAEPAAALVVLLFAMDHCCGFVGWVAAAAVGAAAAVVVVVGEARTRGKWRIVARLALASASGAIQRLKGAGMGCLVGMEAEPWCRCDPREEEEDTPALCKIGMSRKVLKEAGVLPRSGTNPGKQGQRQVVQVVLPAAVWRNSRSVRVNLGQL